LGAGHGGPTGRYDRWRDEARVIRSCSRRRSDYSDIAITASATRTRLRKTCCHPSDARSTIRSSTARVLPFASRAAINTVNAINVSAAIAAYHVRANWHQKRADDDLPPRHH